MEENTKIKILAILGISGSGKTYLAKTLATDFPTRFKKVVQVTTRPPREEEINGEDYYFVDEAMYKAKDSAKILICKTEINGNLYGTELTEFDEEVVNLVVVNSAGAIDLLNFVKTNPADYEVKFVILHPKNNEPYATRHDRDEDFLDKEWEDLNKLAISLPKLHRMNNYNTESGAYLTPLEALDELQKLLPTYVI